MKIHCSTCMRPMEDRDGTEKQWCSVQCAKVEKAKREYVAAIDKFSAFVERLKKTVTALKD